jgi:hypothetical protein
VWDNGAWLKGDLADNLEIDIYIPTEGETVTVINSVNRHTRNRDRKEGG